MLNSHHKVTQSNVLINAKFRLTYTEQMLALLMVSYIQPDDSPDKEYEISFDELNFIIEGRNITQIRNALINIKKKPLIIPKGNGRELITSWFSDAEYCVDERKIIFSISKKMRPYLCELKGNFTSSLMFYLMKFKRASTSRIYMMLDQRRGLRKFNVELDELRDILMVSNTYKKSFSEFKRNIIDVVKDELDEYSDISFDVKYSKRNGKSVSHLEFTIYNNLDNIADVFNGKRNLVLEFAKALKKQNYSYGRKTKIGIYLDGDEVNGALSFKDGLLMKGETSLTKEESFKAYELLYDHWVKGNILEDFEIKE